MEMCYDGTLVMPKNYAVVPEDEMTYVDGGKHLEAEMWLKDARDSLLFELCTYGVGAISAGVGCAGGPIGAAIFALPTIYCGYIIWNVLDCYSQVDKWISQYGEYRCCKMGVSMLGIIATKLEVELLNSYG